MYNGYQISHQSGEPDIVELFTILKNSIINSRNYLVQRLQLKLSTINEHYEEEIPSKNYKRKSEKDDNQIDLLIIIGLKL